MSPRRGAEKPAHPEPGRPRLYAPDPDNGRGTKDDGRQAVLSALPPGHPEPVIITGIWPGLQVRFTRSPVADWLCSCGHHERARGKAAVIELTTRVRVGHCPHRTAPAQERRNAA